MAAPFRSGSSVTLRRIAERAGCSVSVVSTVLNGARGNTGVSAALRERIERCATELGYEANYHARVLRAGRTATIGLVYRPGEGSALHDRFFAPLLSGVEQRVRDAGSDLLVVGPSREESELERGLRYHRQGRVEALVVPGPIYAPQMDWLETLDAPIALALAAGPTRHAFVRIEERSGIAEAVRHLRDLAHREVVWLGVGTDGVECDPRRAAMLCEEAHAVGLVVRPAIAELPADSQSEIATWIDAGEQATRRLLAAGPPPTAVVAYNELVAVGVCAALAARGLRVPANVSVVGFDDITACVAWPPMTVVSLCLREVGAAAAELALAMAEGPGAYRRLREAPVDVPTRLVVRRSTAPAPASSHR